MKYAHSAFAIALLVAATTSTFAGPAAAADATHVHREMIALETDQFTLVETDVSDLAIGESRTVPTDSGSSIDILRTTEGFEVYLDGTLIDLQAPSMGAGQAQVIETVELRCDDAGNCEKTVLIENTDGSVQATANADGDTAIKRIVRVTCEDATACDEALLDAENREGAHLVRIHENAAGAEGPHEKVIVKKVRRTR